MRVKLILKINLLNLFMLKEVLNLHPLKQMFALKFAPKFSMIQKLIEF